jgi:hypothetical protein
MARIRNEYGLTATEERFVQHFVECGNAREAYRRAHPHSRANQNTQRTSAHRMAHTAAVKKRVQSLQQDHRVLHRITVDLLCEHLEAVRLDAMAGGKLHAAIAATMGQARLHGLLVERTLIGARIHGSIHGSIQGAIQGLEGLSDQTLQRLLNDSLLQLGIQPLQSVPGDYAEVIGDLAAPGVPAPGPSARSH